VCLNNEGNGGGQLDPSPSPLAPFLSHAAGEEGGIMSRPGPFRLTPLPRCGRGAGGEGGPHLQFVHPH